MIRFACYGAMTLLAAGAAQALEKARPQDVTTRPDGVLVVRGAEWVGPDVVPEVLYIDTRSRPVRGEWAPGQPWRDVPRRERPHRAPPPALNPVPRGDDPLRARQLAARARADAFGLPLVDVAGQGFTGVVPPDPAGDIGTTHYIQVVNGTSGARWAIHVRSGAAVAGPFDLDGLGSGPCADGLGDGIVLFDELARRWLLTEFTETSNDLCVYVSAGEDPLATTWYRYAFPAPNFPDYPKYGVWPSAYVVGTNEDSPSVAVYALDRERMLQGLPARGIQRFSAPRLAGFAFQLLQPADHDGPAPPPADAPALFLRHRDDEIHDGAANDPGADQLELFALQPDFADPSASHFTGPMRIPVAEFDSRVFGTIGGQAFPQPNGVRLDPLREPVMHRLAYRRHSGFESLVGTFTVDVDGEDTGGLRWFELRRAAGDWALAQEGTFAPADGADRWMGAIAQDTAGNLALAYSVVRQDPPLFPSLAYTGRVAADPPGTLPAGESLFAVGTAAQPGQSRWGDYQALSVDPLDGCTFWFTGTWLPAPTWATRIAAFRHPDCGAPGVLVDAEPRALLACTASGGDVLPPVTLSVVPIGDPPFAGSIAIEAGDDLPPGFAVTVDPPTVQPPASTTATFSALSGAPLGTSALSVRAVGAGVVQPLALSVDLADDTAPAPQPTAPANGALNQPVQPVLSWAAAAQARAYRVELASDPEFANLVYAATVPGTAVGLSVALAPDTAHWWRVRGLNPCGAGAWSTPRRFRTAPPPSQCPTGFTETVYLADDFETGAPGWTAEGSPAGGWTLGAAKAPGAGSVWFAPDVSERSDQRLVAPTVVLPAAPGPLRLAFRQEHALEAPASLSVCYSGAVVERAVDGGPFEPVAADAILADAYDATVATGFENPLAGRSAWCGTRAWRETAIDLAPQAGSAVTLRFRLGTDTDGGVDGWSLDDLRVFGCTAPPDADGDGYGDAIDVCPAVADSGQENRDGDARGDACDACPDAAGDADCQLADGFELPR